MKVIIVEDEHLTAGRIKSLILQIDPGISILAILDSVKSSVEWFRTNEKPDLVFLDIQLADGVSFDIFEKVSIESPIIFITAYQEYAIKAFKVNSVDYLLKPVTEEALRAAIEKYRHYFTNQASYPVIDPEMLGTIRKMIEKPYKSRFMVRIGEHIKSIGVDQILYFYSFQRGTYLHTSDNRNYVVEYSLDLLTDMLDPEQFHRINRSYIISHQAIKSMTALSGSKLKIILLHSEDEDIYVSRDRLANFRTWLDR
jgi:DNA-binding LytR/AlgR family response regulator